MNEHTDKLQECQICASHKKSVFPCPYCSYMSCIACNEHVILDSINLPACVSCKHEWSSDFLHSTFSRAFITKRYQKHREKVLFEREKALLPATQPHVAQARRRMENEKKLLSVRRALNEARARVRELSRMETILRYNALTDEKQNETITDSADEKKQYVAPCPSSECRGFLSSDWKCGLCFHTVCKHCREIFETDHVCNPDTVASVKELAKTTRQCPNCHAPIFKIDGCFAKDQPILMYDGTIKLAQDIDIGDELVGDDVQKRVVLHLTRGEDEMYQVFQNNADTYIVNSQHKLVLKSSLGEEIEIAVQDYLSLPEDIKKVWFGFKKWNGVEQLSTIQVDPIGKGNFYGWSVDQNRRFLAPDHTVMRNCDQMWCVKCNVAFSWTTGKLQSGAIHNPHYFEYLRSRGSELPRNPNEIRCGGMPPASFLSYIAGNFNGSVTYSNYITRVYRMVNHIRQVLLPTLPGPFDNVSNQDLRIEYLLGNISEEEFQVKLQRREKDRNKKLEQRTILETYCNVVQDLLNRLYTEGAKPIRGFGVNEWTEEHATEFVKEEENVRKFTQEAYRKMNEKYSSTIKCPV